MASQSEGFKGDECRLLGQGRPSQAESTLDAIKNCVFKLLRERGPELRRPLTDGGVNSDRALRFAWAIVAPPALDHKQEVCRPQLVVLLCCDYAGRGETYSVALRLAGTQTRRDQARPYSLPQVSEDFLAMDVDEMNRKAKEMGLEFAVTRLAGWRVDWPCKPTADFQAVRDAVGWPTQQNTRLYNAINFACNRPFEKVVGMNGKEANEDAYAIFRCILENFAPLFESGGY